MDNNDLSIPNKQHVGLECTSVLWMLNIRLWYWSNKQLDKGLVFSTKRIVSTKKRGKWLYIHSNIFPKTTTSKKNFRITISQKKNIIIISILVKIVNLRYRISNNCRFFPHNCRFWILVRGKSHKQYVYGLKWYK